MRFGHFLVGVAIARNWEWRHNIIGLYSVLILSMIYCDLNQLPRGSKAPSFTDNDNGMRGRRHELT